MQSVPELYEQLPTSDEDNGVADQARIRGLDAEGDNNIFIPQTREEYKSICNFLDAHSSANYDWIFDRMEGQTGYVKKRND